MDLKEWFTQSVRVPLPLFSLAVGVVIGVAFFGKEEKEEGKQSKTNETKPPNTGNVSPPPPATTVNSTGVIIKGSKSYRFEQELNTRTSSEYTRRGQLWSQHPSWHLPDVPRVNSKIENRYRNAPGFEHVRCILKKYEIDYNHGFLPGDDPLQRLPYARYHVWEDLADDLPKLLGARLGQARSALEQLPLLSIDKLRTDADLRRAHLLLCLFAHAYIWGGNEPKDKLPEGIAKPLWEVSEQLGIPPVLGHTSIVLYNWRRLDIHGEICMENLSTLNNFFDGRDESWFYLITVEIEAKGAQAIIPMLLTNDAIQRYKEEQELIAKQEAEGSLKKGGEVMKDSRYQFNLRLCSQGAMEDENVTETTERDSSFSADEDEDSMIYIHQALVGELSLPRVIVYVTAQLKIVSEAISQMCTSLNAMREGCHPFIFYHRVRPFLSGWKHNPTLPNGLIYEGVSATPYQFYGGSAAQSALIPFLDICFGIEHESHKSKEFLLAMRDYMLKPHREFLSYLETISCLRSFVEARINELSELKQKKVDPAKEKYVAILEDLVEVYNQCIKHISEFRTGHISLVAEYIMKQQKGEMAAKKGGLENNAGGKGTGGTDLMNFLKPIRDDCNDRLLSKSEPRIFEGDSVLVSKSQFSSLPVSSSTASHKDSRSNASSSSTVLVSPPETSTPTKSKTPTDVYIKDNGCIEDIDLYRDSQPPPISSPATAPVTVVAAADSMRMVP